MRCASPDPSTRRRGRVSRPISSARVSPRPVSALPLACLLLALFVPVREVSATRAFGSPAPRPAPGIIAAEGGRFVDPSDGSTFHVAGANCYYLVYSSGADEGSYEHDWVEEILDTSQQLNLNVLRVWTFQDQWWEKERALQTSPGEYNERFLVALDTLIARATARGLRLLLCLSNYWEDYGARDFFFFSDDGDGARNRPDRRARLRNLSPLTTASHRITRLFARIVRIHDHTLRNLRTLSVCFFPYAAGGAMAYVKWAHAAGERAADGAPLRRREDFFTSRLCRDWFKAFVSLMLTRVSSVTGVAYRDDPAIFAWELINEPRVQGDASGDVLQAWIEDVAAYAKTLDDAHLLTVGTEGFYGVTDAARASNEHPPGGGAERLGGDYTRNFYVTELDFACVHLWVDLWLSCDEACKLAFAERWIVGHQNASRLAFDKPVLLEEFGKWKPLGVRDGFFRKALDLSLPPTSPIATHAGGSMFWHIDPTNYPYNEDGFSVQARFETATADIVRGAVARSSSAAGQTNPKSPNSPKPPKPPTETPTGDGTEESSSSPSSSPVYRSPSSHGSGTSAPGTIPRYRFESVPNTADAPSRRGEGEGEPGG